MASRAPARPRPGQLDGEWQGSDPAASRFPGASPSPRSHRRRRHPCQGADHLPRRTGYGRRPHVRLESRTATHRLPHAAGTRPPNQSGLRLAYWRILDEADQPSLIIDRDLPRGPAAIKRGMARIQEGLRFDRGHRPDTPGFVPPRVRANLTTYIHQLRIKPETDRRHHASLTLAGCSVSRLALQRCGQCISSARPPSLEFATRQKPVAQ